MGYGIASGQRPGKTGVWIQADVHSRCINCSPEDKQKPAKIAAIGVKEPAAPQGLLRSTRPQTVKDEKKKDVAVWILRKKEEVEEEEEEKKINFFFYKRCFFFIGCMKKKRCLKCL